MKVLILDENRLSHSILHNIACRAFVESVVCVNINSEGGSVGSMEDISIPLSLLHESAYKNFLIDYEFDMYLLEENKGIPPKGRTQKQHNAIVSLNKKKRF
jgi:hypothetical protein